MADADEVDSPKEPGQELQGVGALNQTEGPQDDPGWGDLDEDPDEEDGTSVEDTTTSEEDASTDGTQAGAETGEVTDTPAEVQTTTEPVEDSDQSTDSDEDAAEESEEDDTPTTGDWEGQTMRFHPTLYDEFTERRLDFKYEYEKRHGTVPNLSATFYTAVMLSAFGDRNLDNILDEILENGIEYALPSTIDWGSLEE